MITRLQCWDIEARPKIVEKAASWRETIGLAKRPDLQKELLPIIHCIRDGNLLPERYYRKNRTTTPDRLLETTGVMHLHLGHPNSRELLFLVQYSTSVLLLEVSDHAHFDNNPPGHVLMTLHKRRIAEWENAQTSTHKPIA